MDYYYINKLLAFLLVIASLIGGLSIQELKSIKLKVISEDCGGYSKQSGEFTIQNKHKDTQ